MSFIDIAKLGSSDNDEGVVDLALEAIKGLRNISTRASYYRDLAAAVGGEKAQEILQLATRTASDISDEADELRTLKSIALTEKYGDHAPDPLDLMLQAGLNQKKLFDEVPLMRRYNLAYVLNLAKEGKHEAAIQALEFVATDREDAVLKLASVFAYSGNKAYFKKLFLPASNYLHACYEISRLTAFQFLNQTDELIETVTHFDSAAYQ